MSSYLATASVGDHTLNRTATADGLPILDFVERDLTPARHATTLASLALQPEMIDSFEGVYGPYPSSSFGSIVDDDDSVGYALETRTRPVYSGRATEGTVAHEPAHQWIGNDVTVRDWRHIWLNEGMGTYAEWMWASTGARAPPRRRSTRCTPGPRTSRSRRSSWPTRAGT